MNNKKLGIFILIIGLIILISSVAIKIKEDKFINKIVIDQGSCFLNDGTCLHTDRDTSLYIVQWVVSALLILLGFYLIFLDKSQKKLNSTIEQHEQSKIEEEKFNILLKGLSEQEQKVIKAVKEQDGITQQTLRLRVDMHKSKLSIILEGLERKGLVTRQEKGKTKQVFLKIAL